MSSPLPSSLPSRSQAGSRLSTRPSPSSQLHSACPLEVEDVHCLGQRSVSLTTLQPTIIQPRMAQLETLEAKMASIEVSLSSTPRRKKNGSLGGFNASIRSIPKEIAAKELNSLRNALRDKENIIQTLKGQLTIPGLKLANIRSATGNNKRCLTEAEKKQAEERLNRLRSDVDNKRLTIKNLKMALERLDITDNIDVRIQQAELEYQLGREELNLLTLLEETRTLQLCIEESNKHSGETQSLYNCVNGSCPVTLRSLEVNFDPKSPKFGVSQRNNEIGLWVDWALEETGLCKDDRLIEVNGKFVFTKNRDDLVRLLAAIPDPAQIVVLRKFSEHGSSNGFTNVTGQEVASLRCELVAVRERAEEAQKTKDALISDNIRLTHRISYLEEQVSEMLCRNNMEQKKPVTTQTPLISTVKTNQNVTNINITTPPIRSSQNVKEVQLFQKGQITTLVSNISGLETSKDTHSGLPVRSRSSLSNVSNTHIPAPSPLPGGTYSCHKTHKHKSSRHSLQTSSSIQNLDESVKSPYRKQNGHHHHHYHREKDYKSEANSSVTNISRLNNKNSENTKKGPASTEKDYENLMDQSYKKATKIVDELTRFNRDSLYEKHKQKCLKASDKYNTDILKHYNSRKSASVLDFRSEIDSTSKYISSQSAEDLEIVNNKPLAVKKFQESRSVKSLDFDSDCNSTTTSCISKAVDYTSEPLENNRKFSTSAYYRELQNRPMPPKKPIRLSLHKTQSLQSVDTNSSVISGNLPSKESRKRHHNGNIPWRKLNGCHEEAEWSNFGKTIAENCVDNGNWC